MGYSLGLAPSRFGFGTLRGGAGRLLAVLWCVGWLRPLGRVRLVAGPPRAGGDRRGEDEHHTGHLAERLADHGTTSAFGVSSIRYRSCRRDSSGVAGRIT